MKLINIFLDSVTSTNKWAKENIEKLDKQALTCITADEQTQAEGRFHRSWVSPKGQNIYATFYFQLPKKTLHLISIGQVASFSIASVLIKEGIKAKIKWPNDVMVADKKIAGILCEASFQDDMVDIFLGLGVNINMGEEYFERIDQPVTSLKYETKKEWNRHDFLKKIQKQFKKDLIRFKKGGLAPCHCQFENLLAYKGEMISFFDGQKKWEGILHSITCDGELNVYFPEKKEIISFLSGDVKCLRRL